MWPLPPIKNESITVIVHSDRVACVWLKSDKEGFRIFGYRSYAIHVGDARLIFNSSSMQQAVEDFINHFGLHYCFVRFVLGPALLDEKLFSVHSGDADAATKLIPSADHQWAYQITYIGPREDIFLYYVCGISRLLYLQLELLQQRLSLHMQAILSPLQTQIEVFRYVSGKAYCKARLAQAADMQAINIPSIFSKELLCRVGISGACISEDVRDPIYAWGSFLGVRS